MRSSLLLLSLFAIATLASIAQLNEIVEIEQQATLLEKLQSPKWTQLFIRMEAMIGRIKNVQKRYKLADTSVECALCGVAANEVEGFMAENMTITEIEQMLDQNVCSMLAGNMQQLCYGLVGDLQTIVDGIDNQLTVSQICISLEYCDQPFENHPDGVPLKKWTLDLSLKPILRWQQICAYPLYQQLAQYLVNTVDALLPGGGQVFEEIGMEINQLIRSDYAQEIHGCAGSLGISTGWLTIMNLGYEVSDACTSIVAEGTDGTIFHARNLDFWDGMFFTDILRNMSIELQVVNGNQLLFRTASIVGFVGFLSAHKPGMFSTTINTRFYPDGVQDMFYEVIAAMTERNATLVTFLLRNVFTNENDFEAAVEQLSTNELIADVYYTVAGVSSGQGAVITRNRFNATDIWRLNASNGEWFILQTNYDHWEQPPWFDDRVHPGYNAMNNMGREKLSLSGLYNVLSTKPVLNLQSTYSTLSMPSNATWLTYQRYCNFPCTE